jgi:hypothetical protein
MIWDRYRIEYRRRGETIVSGAVDAPLVIETELRGGCLPPYGPAPPVASRLGLERNPVDLSRREECDWLRALVWPDHFGRFAKLDRALEIASKETLPIRAGDALELLPEALSAPRRERRSASITALRRISFPSANARRWMMSSWRPACAGQFGGWPSKARFRAKLR